MNSIQSSETMFIESPARLYEMLSVMRRRPESKRRSRILSAFCACGFGDNGTGIDPSVAEMGRDGHWGLQGMRERAQHIGAQLEIWSQAGAGTEVDLSIPGSIAYAVSSKETVDEH